MTETPQRNQTQQGRDVLPSISVVLCCYNSAERLPETLRHLSEQRVPAGLTWEILVIDNASTDDTPQLVQEFSTQHSQLSVRLIHEPQLGAGHARQRGMSEAAHKVILFVDDDNWLASDYLAILAETLRDHQEISGLGGTSSAFCEGPEPPWLARYQGWYALTRTPADRELLREETFLWTAGAAFRRSALDRANALGLPLLVSGRRGNSLEAGEDDELCHLVRLAGGKLYRHSGMHFTHYLPARRLTWDYLGRLFYAAGRVSVKLDAYRLNEEPSPWPRWIVQSCWIQICFACFQTIRYGCGLWADTRGAVSLRTIRKPLPGIFRRRKNCQEVQSRVNDSKAEYVNNLRIAARVRAFEGNDRFLRREVYRGRLAALWAQRRDYENMIARHGGRIAELRRMRPSL